MFLGLPFRHFPKHLKVQNRAFFFLTGFPQYPHPRLGCVFARNLCQHARLQKSGVGRSLLTFTSDIFRQFRHTTVCCLLASDTLRHFKEQKKMFSEK